MKEYIFKFTTQIQAESEWQAKEMLSEEIERGGLNYDMCDMDQWELDAICDITNPFQNEEGN